MVKQAEVKKKQNSFLPVMGLFMAVAFALIAYGVAPLVIDLVKDQFPTRQREINRNLTELTYAFAVLLWLVMFSFSMLVVASFAGEDPEREDTLLRPRDTASEKEWQAYEKKLAKIKEKRLKRVEAVAKQQEQIEAKNRERR